ncbi:Single-stranded nucleic acid binding protein [Mycena indigotica]|uniref:Probable RNA-binding protein 18 n=1 Tax=Mycena indigotica TaxID=2126181 RepID=A0A8H6VYX1_9AGAR|nr:Single-stranded nucleic acid binding protein [Mycena indigotica]KAF7299264.1 Single-stranded nucleic acid binding protein [Mycena indigotica]
MSSSHLTFPTFVSGDDAPEAGSSKIPEPTTRLYVGNLHPSVDEYTLLQIFTKHGRVSKFDFLFHKSGALKGKPRGYAFVEYGDKDVSPTTMLLLSRAHHEADKARIALHDKLLRGRKLVVTFAQYAPVDSGKPRKVMAESGRPTTLSMIKRSTGRTEDKIAMMEAKLRQMAKEESTTGLLPHASLPPKPLPSDIPMGDPQPTRRQSTALPSLPLSNAAADTASLVKTMNSKTKPRKAGVLAGVKLGKPRVSRLE